MLPVILGAVALGAVGYGIKKCLSDESCVDSTKDVIQEGAIKAFEGIEAIEEAFGLNEYTFSKEDMQKKISSSKSIKIAEAKSGAESDGFIKQFEDLYTHKCEIVKELKEKCDITLCSEDAIKQDKTKDVEITSQMITNLSSHIYLSKKLTSSIVNTHMPKSTEELTIYLDALRAILETRIIKKAQFNEKSSQVIQEATNLLMQEKEPLFVSLEGEV